MEYRTVSFEIEQSAKRPEVEKNKIEKIEKPSIVILGTPRFGTHFLASLFEANGFKNYEEYPIDVRRKIRSKEDELELDDFAMDIFLEELSFNESVFIIQKVHLDWFLKRDVRGISYDYFLDKVLEKSNVKFVILKRDFFDAAVSVYFANKTNRYHNVKNFVGVEKPDYNFKEILNRFNLLKKWHWSEEYLERYGPIFVNYEDLVKDTKKEFSRICQEMGFEAKIFKQSRYKKYFDPSKEKQIEMFKREYQNEN